MSKGPSRSQALALKAAALANIEPDEDEVEAAADAAMDNLAGSTSPQVATPASERIGPARGGRPKGRRAVAARQTIYLDEKRHAALARIADDRGRSVHSLILEGIDHVIGKPIRSGWEQ